jgi:hypothetical protein
MRVLIVSRIDIAAAIAAVCAICATTPASAQNYPWCLVNYKYGSTSCAFTSRAQCMMSAGGNIGQCVANPALGRSHRKHDAAR